MTKKGHVASGSVAAAVAAALMAVSAVSAQPAPSIDGRVDAIFTRWSDRTPGCAVAGSKDGQLKVLRTYGLADLEHDVRIIPETIFEAGSVSKQFTAAAVLLLARDGKLSLDDQVRKYITELPDYGASLTIRHMLNHTSGLRDWGSVAAIGGWPRTSRVHTNAHVVDMAARQGTLNFPTGTRWSYTNTGYNLAAEIVARVSGMSFADFTRTRIFEPLGMTRTSWRDDHTRIVKGRAIAYLAARNEFHTQMPFENVYGNGGLLTTVGDLLRWNENFVTPKVGDASFVRDMQERGKFSDGRAHGYALGLFVGAFGGRTEFSHGGATGGYRADLVRYPDERVSVAVLCNVTSAAASTYSRAVADLLLSRGVPTPSTPSAPAYALTEADYSRIVGMYRNTTAPVPSVMGLARDGSGLRLMPNQPLVAESGSRFVTPGDLRLEIEEDGTLRSTDAFGTVDRFERVSPASPTLEQLRTLAGVYVSDEAEVTYHVGVEGAELKLTRRPDVTSPLRPLYRDAFDSNIGLLIFRRNSGGQVIGFSVTQERAWDVRFARMDTAK
jgi:CubicO group peptidase (beta-lactamase class C family)